AHGESDSVTLVLDARGAVAGVDEDDIRGSIAIHYALREEADDFIERQIAHDAAPAKLIVVSSDRRPPHAAKRRGCESWTSLDYVDWMDRTQRERARTKPAEPDKPASMSENERKSWEQIFGDIEDV